MTLHSLIFREKFNLCIVRSFREIDDSISLFNKIFRMLYLKQNDRDDRAGAMKS